MALSPHSAPGRRIVVVGASGSGKTFIAERLAQNLRIPYVCNDAILFRENWLPNPRRYEEFDIATRDDAWTFDGNIGAQKAAEDILILRRADTLVWIDLPRLESMRQLLLRTARRSWTKQPLWHGNTESWRLSFASRDSVLRWAWITHEARRQQYRRIFADPAWAHLRRIRLTSRAAVNRWLAQAGRADFA